MNLPFVMYCHYIEFTQPDTHLIILLIEESKSYKFRWHKGKCWQFSFLAELVRVLSLRSSVIRSLLMHFLDCVPCFVMECGVRIQALMSWVSWRGYALFCPRVLCCCTQFVFLSAACILVMSCAVWHAAYVFIGCVLSCRHVFCEHVAYEYFH